MNSEKFEKLLKRRISKIKEVLGEKANEYAADTDMLYNFKRQAEIKREAPEEALCGNFTKHLVSVLDIVEGRIPTTREMIDEKVGDSINYLILLEAIFVENIKGGN